MRFTGCLALIVSLLLSACGGGGSSSAGPTPGPSPTTEQRTFKDIVYTTVPRAIRLDLHLPSTGTGPFPVFVQIHGGGWSTGSKDTPYWSDVAIMLRSRGYAVINMDYRLSGEAKWPAQLHDSKAVIRWVRANAATYKLDANRIAVWGQSSGALMADLLALTEGNTQFEDLSQGNPSFSSKVQAVVHWYGWSTFLNLPPGAMLEDSTALLGCDPRQCTDVAVAASPVTYVRAGAPPFLIMHGTDDPIVPVAASEELAARLQAAGVPVELRVLGGYGHGTPLTMWTNEMNGVGQWLDTVMR